MLNNAKLGQRTLFWQHKDQKAMRQGKWKLIVQKGKTQLFDLGSDLAEKNDLAATEKAVTARMVKLLNRWQREVWAGVEKRS
jgi:arylsulfatase